MTVEGRLALAIATCGLLLHTVFEAQAMREDEAVAAFRKLEATCSARLGAEALAPLRARFPLGPREAPSPAMLASRDKPSAAERAAIRALAPISQDCNRMTAEVYDRYVTPIHLVIFRTAAVQREMLLVQLHDGRLSFGEYNQQRTRVQEELLSNMGRLHQALESGNAQAGDELHKVAQRRYEEALRQQKELAERQRGRKAAGRCERIGAFEYCEN